jgi:hypothetical protein
MGSVPHAFRLERDVLAHGPVDLLFLEAAVNDSSNMPGRPDLMLRGMEGVVRHMRLVSPRTDIVQLHFVMEPHMADYRANRAPDSIAQHERVAIAYGNPSLNLAKEVTERIDAGEFTWAADFKNLHPSPFGHRLYAHGVARMLGAAFAGPVAEAVKPHPLPPALDPRSYARGRLGDLAQIRPGKGFELIRSWAPADDAKNTKGKKIGTRAGFVHVPALVGTEPGAEFAFDFHGTACGLFIATGPDAGQIEFSVDGRPWQTVETYTSWSGTLHLPWALVLDDHLPEGDHAVRVRILASRSPKSEGTTLRVFHLLLN